MILDDECVIIDTNIMIYLQQENEYGQRYARIISGRPLAITFITVAELLLNAKRSKNPARTEQYWLDRFERMVIINSDLLTSVIWSEICATQMAAGRPAQDNDLWIAACALRWDISLATHNTRDFAQIPQLRLITLPD